jgi:two-component system, LytTR family, response regulator AlgR
MSTAAQRILIVDDEAPARRRLRELIGDCAAVLALEVIGEAGDGHEALAVLNERRADVVLLDIRMPGMDGIELARHIQKLDTPPAVVFTTAYDAYAVKAFELNAIDYLLKPIRAERLALALKKAVASNALSATALAQLAPKARTHLSINERGRVVLVAVADIVFLRAEQKYVTVRTLAREFLLEESLIGLEQEFAQEFVRVHRSALVAKAAIEGFERASAQEAGEAHWQVMLRGLPERLPVSRRQQHIVREFGSKAS